MRISAKPNRGAVDPRLYHATQLPIELVEMASEEISDREYEELLAERKRRQQRELEADPENARPAQLSPAPSRVQYEFADEAA